LLDTNQLLSEVSSKTLQAYIDARTLEKGEGRKTVRRETVHKEIGTFSSVWNKWGIQQGLTDRPAPVKNLTYPKGPQSRTGTRKVQYHHQVCADPWEFRLVEKLSGIERGDLPELPDDPFRREFVPLADTLHSPPVRWVVGPYQSGPSP
jgi:hypothetical protein